MFFVRISNFQTELRCLKLLSCFKVYKSHFNDHFIMTEMSTQKPVEENMHVHVRTHTLKQQLPNLYEPSPWSVPPPLFNCFLCQPSPPVLPSWAFCSFAYPWISAVTLLFVLSSLLLLLLSLFHRSAGLPLFSY